MKAKILVLATALAIGGSTLATAQDRDDHRDRGERNRQVQRDNDRRDNDRQVRTDRDDHRDRDDRQVRVDRDGDRYRGNVYTYGDGDRDDRPVYSSPYYGYGYPVYNNGGYAMQSAQQFGYNDGLQEGARDRATGHSFRPTQHDSFRDADHGYSGNVDVSTYRAYYRQAYENGYQAGYSGSY